MPAPYCPDAKYRYFSHTECECFPCHEMPAGAGFNCLFCYCPLYALGSACGGAFTYLPDGIKDCSKCTFPHEPASYDEIIARYDEIKELAREKR